MIRKIHSFKSEIFNSFDALVDYIDNLGDDTIFISNVRGYTPVIFLNKTIGKTEYKNIECSVFYKELDKHAFRQITYRAKELGYELNTPVLKDQGATAFYPYNLYNNTNVSHFIFPKDNTQAFELGDEYLNTYEGKAEVFNKYGLSHLMTRNKNYFKLEREFRMAGMPFSSSDSFIKVGFDFYYWTKNKETWNTAVK